MEKVKKRKKAERHRGSHTHGRGAKKRARGSGHRGGVGKAGSGKRADHKKIMKTVSGKKYFGKSKVRRAATKKDISFISLEKIKDNINGFVKKGIAKKTESGYEFDLKKYKIIGDDNLDVKVKIHAKAASKGAVEAVKKANGEILIEA